MHFFNGAALTLTVTTGT